MRPGQILSYSRISWRYRIYQCHSREVLPGLQQGEADGTGIFETCLCYEDGIDLKHILRSLDEAACREENIEEAIRNAVWEKACAHCFEKPSDMTEENPMSSIGG